MEVALVELQRLVLRAGHVVEALASRRLRCLVGSAVEDQAPIESGFGAASTAAEVIAGRDLTGKTVVVTGGYSGIGVETVRAFRSVGANVVVLARDLAKAAGSRRGEDGRRLSARRPDSKIEPNPVADHLASRRHQI